MPISCPTASRIVQAWKPYGEVQVRRYCQPSGEKKIFSLGQVSEVNIAYEITEDSLPDYILGGGESASDSRIDSMGLGMVCHEPGDLDVLALLTLGSRATVALDAAATQAEKAYLDAPLWVDNIPTSITSIVATDGDAASTWSTGATIAIGDAIVPITPNTYWYQAEDAGTTDPSTEPTWPTTTGATVEDNGITWRCMGLITLVADTDYTVGNFGVDIESDARIYTGADNDVGVDVTITYAHAAQAIVHAAMNTGIENEVRFAGYNKALSDKKMLVHIWRAKSAPPDQLPLIATEYAGLNTTFKILSHSGASASESAFFSYREISS
jgi:hypothetical protein